MDNYFERVLLFREGATHDRVIGFSWRPFLHASNNFQAVSGRQFASRRFSQLNDERCLHVSERLPSKCCYLPVSEALCVEIGKKSGHIWMASVH